MKPESAEKVERSIFAAYQRGQLKGGTSHARMCLTTSWGVGKKVSDEEVKGILQSIGVNEQKSVKVTVSGHEWGRG